MQEQKNEYDYKLEEILKVLREEGYLTGRDWDIFGKQVMENFEHYSTYHKQTLIHSLKLIMNSRDQLNTTREVLKRLDSMIQRPPL